MGDAEGEEEMVGAVLTVGEAEGPGEMVGANEIDDWSLEGREEINNHM